jgi:hypothetical protein
MRLAVQVWRCRHVEGVSCAEPAPALAAAWGGGGGNCWTGRSFSFSCACVCVVLCGLAKAACTAPKGLGAFC